MLLFNTKVGRFGNQLFVYAAATAYNQQNNKRICFSDLDILKEYCQLSISDRYLNNFKKWFFTYVLHRYKKIKRLDFKDCWQDHSRQLNALDGHYEVHGYFQGDMYFAEYAGLVKKRLRLKQKYIDRFREIRENLGQKPLAVVHIRRTDYKHFDLPIGDKKVRSDLRQPFSYYEKQLRQIDLEKYQLVFISDAIDEVKQHFANYDAYFSDHESIIDFQFLMHAAICILSSSSFSWWGAYLNSHSEKKIYIPRYYCGFQLKSEFPVNIIPTAWNQVDILALTETNQHNQI